MRLLGKSVQRKITDANEQIKTTRTALSMPDAYGLLVFITPPFRLNRWSIGWLAHNSFQGGSCTAINGLMIIETPIAANGFGTPHPETMISFHRRDRTLPTALKQRIGASWGDLTNQEIRMGAEEQFFQPTPKWKGGKP